ncbi:MAG: phenylalanine--tRNA ligase subunit beta [FCB group bacterium]|nr:phenylalanine--tRNA ligase subunit beta [FCB group bacterium]
MKISINWLRQFVNIEETPEQLADMLSMLGMEAEIGLDLSEIKDVVTAKVLAVDQHPNADKLKLCLVNDGGQDYRVVCGAPNVEAGQVVPFAKVGSVLPGKIKIQKAKIRGEVSFGMLCSERELGISDEHTGIMILPEDTEIGQPVAEILNRSFGSLELDITPNRPDALSHLGIAREIAVKTGRKLKKPEIHVRTSAQESEPVEVIIDDPDGCPRYVAGVVKNVKVGPSPQWMVDYLKAAGQRSINNIVDISNYVLLEMGHPTHMFDYDRFETRQVVIRRAEKGELFVTLDEEKHELNEHHLLITDGEKPVALAGIMGGLNSAVSDKTNTVLIESAYFDPLTIRKGAKSLGMLTEASRRFERGADPEATMTAFWRIVNLLEEYAAGELASKVVDAYPKIITRPKIELRKSKLELVSGVKYDDQFIAQCLSGLEISWQQPESDVWECIPPSFRPDLEREIDLIEEMIRLQGYDTISPSRRFTSSFPTSKVDPLDSVGPIIDAFVGLGFHQCYNNSLQPKKYAASLGKTPVVMLNPLSEQMSVLRTSLLPGLLQTVDFNIKNGNKNLLLFETGQVHEQESDGFAGIKERFVLAGVVHGLINEKNVHTSQDRPHSFYSLKGLLDSALKRIAKTKPRYEDQDHNGYNPCNQVLINDTPIGIMGRVRPDYIELLKLETGDVFGFELDLNVLTGIYDKPIVYKPISVFPKINRDVNFILDRAIKTAAVTEKIYKVNRELIKDVRPIDIYEHESLGRDKKSVVFNIVFQSDVRTLEDKEVNSIINEIISVVSKHFGAKLRA